MQMTTQLKAIALAVGMTLGLGAQAAQINVDNIAAPFTGTGAGSLLLAMYDVVGQRTLMFNTGLTADSFNAQAGASFDVNIQAADKTKINQFLGAVADPAKLQWNIAAIDNRLINGAAFDSLGFQTTLKAGSTFVSGPGDVGAILGVLANMPEFMQSLNGSLNGATNNVATSLGADGQSSFAGPWDGNLNNAGEFNNIGNLGGKLDYYFYHGVGEDPSIVAFDKYKGQWSLNFSSAQGAALSYTVTTAPVPVPPAMLLMGSALAGLAATRRRKAA